MTTLNNTDEVRAAAKRASRNAARRVRKSSIASKSHLTVTAGRRSTKGTGGSFARPNTTHHTDRTGR